MSGKDIICWVYVGITNMIRDHISKFSQLVTLSGLMTPEVKPPYFLKHSPPSFSQTLLFVARSQAAHVK